MNTWIAYRGHSSTDAAYVLIVADTKAEAAAIALVYGVTNAPTDHDPCHWFANVPRHVFSSPRAFSRRNARIDAALVLSAKKIRLFNERYPTKLVPFNLKYRN